MPEIVICRDCELKQKLPGRPEGRLLRCARCGTIIKRVQLVSLDALMALTLAALIMWCAANFTPFMTLDYKGGTSTAFLVTGGRVLWTDEFFLVGSLVLLTSILVPLLHIVIVGGALLALRAGFRGPYVASMIRLTTVMGRWAMPGIYLIGVLVASVKISQMASLDAGPGLYALVGMVLVWTSITASLDCDALFTFLEEES